LQILAIAQAIAAVCALPWARIHRFHFMQLFAGQNTGQPSPPFLISLKRFSVKPFC
jgi:hypothetical protein